MVIADHEPAAAGEHPTEALLPPEHRGTDAHDQEDRRVGRLAEGLRAELDTVGFDHALGQLRSSSREQPAQRRVVPNFELGQPGATGPRIDLENSLSAL